MSDEAIESLRDDPRVAALAVGSPSFGGALEVEGRRVDGIALGALKGDIAPPLLEGRAPVRADEIALGPRTLRSLHREVGDVIEVRVRGVGASQAMRVRHRCFRR
ncbi:MAG: hypothetical protein ACRD29_03085 [Acidimicrobiales bacterium]